MQRKLSLREKKNKHKKVSKTKHQARRRMNGLKCSDRSPEIETYTGTLKLKFRGDNLKQRKLSGLADRSTQVF